MARASSSPIVPVALLAWASLPTDLAAQICQMSEAARASLPVEAPEAVPYAPLGHGATPFAQIPLGIGHVHRSPEAAHVDLPPGTDDWLRRVELPLSDEPGAAPRGWLARGWIVRPEFGAQALTTDGLIETGHEEASFLVLEESGNWLRLRYAPGEAGTAWVPRCALSRSPERLTFSAWSEWLLRADVSPLFVRVGASIDLLSEPSPSALRIGVTTTSGVLEPLEVRGSWMRVTLVEPSDYCLPDVAASRTDGWVRWTTDELGPILWYFTRGC